MAKRWRCMWCNIPRGYEFTADGPQCPSCKRTGALILPLVDIHWLEEDADGPIVGQASRLRVGCMPKRPNLTGLSATPVLTIVSCPACRDTENFRRAWEEWASTWPDLANEWVEQQTNKG